MSDWSSKCEQKKAERDHRIPQEWRIEELLVSDKVKNVLDVPVRSGIMSELELEITEIQEASVLLSRIADKTYAALAVTTAFCKRAAIAQQVVNCLTEINFEKALQRAQALDEYYSTSCKLAGPLHGLPISLKDQFLVKGLDTSMGYTAWLGKPAEINSAIVDILESQGAISFTKTNVSMSLMRGETINNVFGRTLNPQNRDLVAGGSSGGESALVKMKGSILGVGSDIGGSIRVPASMCGLYGLRPSTGRVPYRDAVNSMEGQESVASVAGPITTSLDSIEVFMKAVADGQPWLKDPKVVPIPWRQVTLPKRLKFGYFVDDGVIRAHPPIRRVIHETVKKLQAAGHEAIEWDAADHNETYSLIGQMLGADGGKDVLDALAASGEPQIMDLIIGTPKDALSAYEMWQVNRARTAYTEKFLDRWNASGIDFILCPVQPFVHRRHDTVACFSYTMQWNVLDYPGLTMPIDKFSATVDDLTLNEDARTDLEKVNNIFYQNPQEFEGMDICLQVVCRRLEEEKVVAVGKEIERILRGL